MLKTFLDYFSTIQIQYYPHASNPLHQACLYALNLPGKRIRPQLTLLCNETLKGHISSALDPACAIEWIHTYSLVHDDLPCLDKATLRRGAKTLHLAFDEATALLAGDALLTDAFSILSRARNLSPQTQISMLQILSQSAGGTGMVYGQMLDWIGIHPHKADAHTLLQTIHHHKTGDLMASCCILGGLSSPHQSPEIIEALKQFGYGLGLVFQIQDDLLDLSTSTQTGKDAHKDLSCENKVTFAKIYKKEELSDICADLTQTCIRHLDVLKPTFQTDDLKNFAQQMLNRNR
jgi:geranylgeranyl pyrophosphate synthase